MCYPKHMEVADRGSAMKNNLKQIREMRNLEQADVARDLDISLSTYRSWEQGARGLKGDKLIRFAEYFGVSTDAILGTQYSELNHSVALTTDEERLVAAYRQLDEGQQSTVLGMVEGLASK